MISALARAWFPVLLIACGVFAAAQHAVRPMVAYRALDLGADPFQLGIVASAYAALALFAAIPAGRWIDRHGEGPFLLLGGLVSAGAVAAMTVSDSLVVLAIDHALLGLGQVILVVAIQTFIANRSEPRDRGRRFGYFAAMFAVGAAVGPLSGGLIAAAGPGAIRDGSAVGTSLVFAVATVPILLATLLLLAISARGARRGSRPALIAAGLRRAIRARPSVGLGQAIALFGLPGVRAVLAASIVVDVSVDLLTAYLPAYGRELGFSVAEVSLLLSIRATSTLVSRVVIGRQVRRWGEVSTFAHSMLIAAGGFALLLTGRWELAIVALAAVGFGLGVGVPLTMTMVVNATPSELHASSLGMRMTANRLGELTVPWLVGLVAGATAVAAVFVLLIAMLGSAGVVARRVLIPANPPEPLPARAASADETDRPP